MINTKKIDSFIEGKRGAVIEGEGFITTGEPARSSFCAVRSYQESRSRRRTGVESIAMLVC